MQVLLLDEITVDLDVLGRSDLMAFLAEECESRGATIIYATHIFDGLESWPTHVAYVARGEQGASWVSMLACVVILTGVSGWGCAGRCCIRSTTHSQACPSRHTNTQAASSL